MKDSVVKFSLACGFAVVLLQLSAVPLRGQAVAGAQISGFVTDPSGAAVVGAELTATRADTNAVRTSRTDPSGAYVIPNLPVGPYTLEVTSSGFAKYIQTGILLSVGNDVKINVALTIGTTQQEFRVTANAGMVETHDTSTSQVIDQQRVLDLPLNGRQAASLVLLSGGAANASFVGDLASTKNYGSTNISGTAAISVAGGQGNGTNFMMDGGDNNDPFSNVALPFPFPDAIQEFSVETGGLSARYGLHPGGVVNIVTKSGTNQYHGGLFEFLRNGDVNARNFFAATPDPQKRNQFGGTVGGPVKRDRVFFFLGYQGTRIRSYPASTVSYVPTSAVLNGNFTLLESSACQSTGKAKTITNPATGQPFPGAQVPVSLFNPQALALLKYLPVSANQCGALTYPIPNPQDENQYIARGDWVGSEKHSIAFRYFWTGLNNPYPPFNKNLLQTTRSGLLDQAYSAIVSDTYTFSPTAVNSLHLNMTRVVTNRTNSPDDINPQTVGINVSVGAPNFINMNISNYFTMGCGSCANQHAGHTVAQAADDFDLIHGRHHISFGASGMDMAFSSTNLYIASGVWTFNGTFSGDALLDFMLGDPNSFNQGSTSILAVRQPYVGVYGQDDLQVNRRLQVHFGLRWEPFLAGKDLYGRGYSFDPQAFVKGATSTVFVNAPPGLSFIRDPGVPSRYANSKLLDFEPRVGVAWDPAGNGRQTIRASYGIFYDARSLSFNTTEDKSPPWGSSLVLSSPPNGLTNPYASYPGGNPFPAPAPSSTVAFPTAGIYISVPPNINPTYTQEWSVSYQRQVRVNTLLSATYMGNKATHVWGATEEDPAVYIPGTCNGAPCSSTANTAQRRVLYLENPKSGAYYSTMAEADDGANSEYNALLLSGQHRYSDSYSVLANYTYSHCISEGIDVGDMTGPQYQNPYSRDRANCAFDLRQIFNFSVVAQMPRFKEKWKRRVLNNWQIAPLISVHSGRWFSPLTGTDKSLTGVGLDRPNMVGDPYATNTSASPVRWLNPAAFVANATGTFGNAGAYSLQGPGYVDADVAVTRSFTFKRESQGLQVRFEAFNLFNRANFSNPTATLSSAQFGTITAANDPRILQFVMKFHF